MVWTPLALFAIAKIPPTRFISFEKIRTDFPRNEMLDVKRNIVLAVAFNYLLAMKEIERKNLGLELSRHITIERERQSDDDLKFECFPVEFPRCATYFVTDEV